MTSRMIAVMPISRPAWRCEILSGSPKKMRMASPTYLSIASPNLRGAKLGGWTAGSERSAKEAAALAERMRPVMAQLVGLSAHKAAAVLNRRKIASATGGKWYAATVIKLRDRLEA